MRRLPVVLLVLLAAVPVLAQSLAEIAARDQERRSKQRASPAPAYSDEDLRASPSPSPSASPTADGPLVWPSGEPPPPSPAARTSSPPPAAPAGTRPAQPGWKAPTPKPIPPPVPASPGTTAPRASASPSPIPSPSPTPDRSEQERAQLEARWRGIAKQRRDALAAAETRVAELRQRLAGVTNDLSPTNLGDPNREQTLRAQAGEARAQLEAAEAELARAKKAVDDLEDDARRAGALPGWVR